MIKKLISLNKMFFMTWDGEYRKQFYDVMTYDGEVILHCWPNANKMCSTDGSGCYWCVNDNISVRESLTHPLDKYKDL